jgi:hypothetical protein
VLSTKVMVMGACYFLQHWDLPFLTTGVSGGRVVLAFAATYDVMSIQRDYDATFRTQIMLHQQRRIKPNIS